MIKNKKITCLIIDDEPVARDIIRNFLKEEEDIEIAGECSNGVEAVSKILEIKPELIFLDVQMPGLNGLEVIEIIEKQYLPHVIFITAYDQYAVKAFEINAIDYLLKPVDKNRFKNSIEKGKKLILSKNSIKNQLNDLLLTLSKKDSYLKRMVVKYKDRYILINTSEIMWFEAASDYVTIHLKKDNFFIKDTIKNLEKKLNPAVFVRTHRSFLVNINYVKEFQPLDAKNHILVMHNGSELKLSLKYRKNFFSVLYSEDQK